jgi:hypothetical protein
VHFSVNAKDMLYRHIHTLRQFGYFGSRLPLKLDIRREREGNRIKGRERGETEES